MLNFETHNTLETEKLGEQLAKSLTGNEIIAFFGTMGMGKTAFIRGLCNGLECLDDVSSPTFAIVHEYKGKYPVFHFDMYRIKDYDDLYSTGFFEYLNNGILLIEWSENIDNIIPDDAIKITIKKGSQDEDRIINIEGIDKI
mgnify:CR=1 FL=1